MMYAVREYVGASNIMMGIIYAEMKDSNLRKFLHNCLGSLRVKQCAYKQVIYAGEVYDINDK